MRYINSLALSIVIGQITVSINKKNMTETNITDAEFNTISDEQSRFMLKNAHQAITLTEYWDYMKTFSGESFMFSDSPAVSTIMSKMRQLGYDGHSGGSFGWTMRQMEFLAKNGKQAFFQQFV